jgi:hypothetical protein
LFLPRDGHRFTKIIGASQTVLAPPPAFVCTPLKAFNDKFCCDRAVKVASFNEICTLYVSDILFSPVPDSDTEFATAFRTFKRFPLSCRKIFPRRFGRRNKEKLLAQINYD